MAISKNNPITKGLSGMLGKVIVFKTLRGKTIIANRPAKPTRESAVQRENRDRFRQATAYAKAVMKDSQKKIYYQTKARKLKLPNGYTAAITDFMRKPEINKVDATKYTNRAGGHILIKAWKNNFALDSIDVRILDAQDLILASANAMQKDSWSDQWVASFTDYLSGNADKIIVTVKDRTGNSYPLTIPFTINE